jgi:hypothetical protein
MAYGNKMLWAATAGTVALLIGATADAQSYDRGRNVSVTQQERPGYSAGGIHEGGFTIFPKLTTDFNYTSNLFAQESNAVADGYVSIRPSIEAVSNWGRHELRANVSANIRQYDQHTSENETGWTVGTSGRLDIYEHDTASGSLQAQRIYEERRSTQSPTTAAEPIPINSYIGTLRGVHEFNRLRLTGGAIVRKLDYHNVPSIGGGVVDVNGRDRSGYTGDVKAEYGLSPDTAVYVQTSYLDTHYDHPLPTDPNRNSKELSVLGGANFDLTALMRGDIGVGYTSRKYDNAAFGTMKGFRVNGIVEYFPSRVTTVTLNLWRSVEDAVDTEKGGFFLSVIGLTVDHEVRRNILVNAGANFSSEKYQGIDRLNKTSNYSVGGVYLVNRGVGLNLKVQHSRRNSTGADRIHDFNETTALLGVVLQR